jgi:hypothetical protein
MSAKAIEKLTAPEEQHMLFLFLPLRSGKKGAETEAAGALHSIFSGQRADGAPALSDPRVATGVHFYMAYLLLAGMPPAAPPPPFPTFQLPPPNPKTGAPRHLAVVMSIYDSDFGPYIGAFTSDKDFAAGLDKNLLENLDEEGFVDPTDSSSAANILANKGTFAHPGDFLKLLMRYNWADPTIPAATSIGKIKKPNLAWKYFLGATFPGLTIGRLLKATGGYPNAAELWPFPGGVIDYAPSAPPV